MMKDVLQDGSRLYEVVAVCQETGDVFHVWNTGPEELDSTERAAGYADKVFGKVYFVTTAPDCSNDAHSTLNLRFGTGITSYIRHPIRDEENLVSRVMMALYGRLRDFTIISNTQGE